MAICVSIAVQRRRIASQQSTIVLLREMVVARLTETAK
jgi:hypothetical protein